MKFRKFLLHLRLFGRYRYFKRHFNRQKAENARILGASAADKEQLRQYYEKRLEISRVEQKELLFALTDRALQASKMTAVSHVTLDAADKAERNLNPAPEPPYDPEKELKGDVLGFYLDAKEGFFEAEAENGRTDMEIEALWRNEYGPLAMAQARSQVG